MERRPSSLGGFRSRSVGSFGAFFDFYQNQDALLTTKPSDGKDGDSIKNEEGIERLGHDVSRFIPSRQEQNQVMSVRDMLAQREPSEELTKCLKAKIKSSNVVAKLMGLESLPASSPSVQKEKHFTRYENLSSRHHHSKTASQCSAEPHYGNDKAAAVFCTDDFVAQRRPRWDEPISPLTSRSPPSYMPESIDCEACGQIDDPTEAVDDKERQRHLLFKHTRKQERMHTNPSSQRMCKSKDLKDNIRSTFPCEQPCSLFTDDNEEDSVSEIKIKNRLPLENDFGTSKLVTTHSEIVGLGSLQRKKHATLPFPILDDASRSQMLVRKMLNAVKFSVKRSLTHNKYRNAPDKFCEEKELTNTISFLEANRDYFRKFLKHPHQESAKKSQNTELNLFKTSIREYSECHENYVDGLHKRIQMDKSVKQLKSCFHTERGTLDNQRGRKQVDVKLPAAMNIVVLRPGTGKVIALPSDRSSNTVENAEEDETDVLKELRGRFQLPHSKRIQSRERVKRSSTDNQSITRHKVKHVREHGFGSLTEYSMGIVESRNSEPNCNGTSRKIEISCSDKPAQRDPDLSHSFCLSESRSAASQERRHEESAAESNAQHSAVSELERESLSSSTQNLFHIPTSTHKQVSCIGSPGMNLQTKGEQYFSYKSTYVKVQRDALDCPPQKLYGSIRGACREEIECDKHGTIETISDMQLCTSKKHNLPACHYEQPLKIIENSCQRSSNSSSESSTRISVDEMMSIMSDISKDSSGQPSPISVLDSNSSYSTASRVINSAELQDLEMRIRFLKSLEQQRVEESNTFEETDHVTDGNTRQFQSNICDFEESVSNDILTQEGVDFVADGIEFPKANDPVLLCLRNLLVESGITADNTASLTYLYDSKQNLGNSIFAKMENKLSQIMYSICSDQKQDKKRDLYSPLLFLDRVKEILHDLLQPKPNCVMLLQGVNLNQHRLRPNLNGKELLKSMWSGVCELLQSEAKTKSTLEKLVENDLHRCEFLEFGLDIEVVVFEVEGAILNDVILEMITSFFSICS